jgi:hypothetical protein
MRGQSALRRKLFPCFAALLMFVSPLLVMAAGAADAPGPSDVAAAAPPSGDLPGPGAPDVPTGPSDAAPNAPNAPGFNTVNLRVDGNIAGRARMIDASGNLVPMRATISFMQDGRVVTVARSDESGNFQVVGLRPGTYSVVAIARSASGEAYVSAFSVQVLPFAEETPNGQQLLDITLMPANDLMKLLGQQASGTPPPSQPQPYMGSGGGGGGGGLGALLGLAGLAALAAAGQQDGQNEPASPNVP